MLMVCGRWSLWEVTGFRWSHKRRTLMMRYKKRKREVTICASCACRGQTLWGHRQTAAVCKSHASWLGITSPGTLFLDSQAPKLKKKCQLFKPSRLWYFAMAGLGNSYTAQAQNLPNPSYDPPSQLPLTHPSLIIICVYFLSTNSILQEMFSSSWKRCTRPANQKVDSQSHLMAIY